MKQVIASSSPVLDSLEYHKRYYKALIKGIPPSAVSIVKVLLREQMLPPLPKDWDWDWMIESGKYRGDLPRRISAYYHEKFKLDLSPIVLANIGSKARSMMYILPETWYDFDRELNWKAGDFGDGQSCFWKSQQHSRKFMQSSGQAAAIRFWTKRTPETYIVNKGTPHYYPDPETKEEFVGIGRAWIAELGSLPAGSVIIFNAYGSFNLDQIAPILRDHLSLPATKKTRAFNRYDSEGQVHMNGDSGILIGKNSVLSIDEVLINWKKKQVTCEYCTRRVCASNAHLERSTGLYICNSCWDDRYFKCPTCLGNFKLSDTPYLEVRRATGLRKACVRCVTDYYAVCVHCQERNLRTSMKPGTGGFLCLRCWTRQTRTCNGCHKEYDSNLVRCPKCNTHKNTSGEALFRLRHLRYFR